jgi:hypothetical protein
VPSASRLVTGGSSPLSHVSPERFRLACTIEARRDCRRCGSAFGACCCCAGKLRSPAPLNAGRASPGSTLGPRRVVQPLCQSLRQPLRQSPRIRWRTPPCLRHRRYRSPEPLRGASRPQKPRATLPPRGVERPRRKVRFARLIQRRVRAFWRTCGPRRLRRQCEPGLVATRRDTGILASARAQLPAGVRCGAAGELAHLHHLHPMFIPTEGCPRPASCALLVEPGVVSDAGPAPA